MNRYYEGGLPASNYHGPLPDVAFGENNHIAQVLIDHSNEYGTRVVIGCWSEHDDVDAGLYWYTIRDHKGDVLVAALTTPPSDAQLEEWELVWSGAV